MAPTLLTAGAMQQRARLVLLPILLLAACGSDRSGPEGGGGTDAGPMVRVDSGPSGGTDAGPTGGVDAGPTGGSDSGPVMMGTGACTNMADLDRMVMHDMDMVVGSCAEECFGAAACSRDCVIRVTMISMPCGQCWGDVVGCTSSMCAFQCLGGESPECSMCRDDSGCTAAFRMCSGLEG